METSRAAQLTIRSAHERDRDRIWQIFQATIAPGDAFVYDPTTPRKEAMAYWLANGTRTFVAEEDGKIVGSYATEEIIIANQVSIFHQRLLAVSLSYHDPSESV